MSFELLTCAVTKLHIEFVAPPDSTKFRGEVLTMNFKSGIAEHVSDPRQFKVFLAAKFSEHTAEKVPLGFQVETSITGYVRVAQDIPEDKVAQNAYMNAISSLYGTLRGVIMSATGTFPTGPLILKSRTSVQIIGPTDPNPKKMGGTSVAPPKVRSQESRFRRKPPEKGSAGEQRVIERVIEKAGPLAGKLRKAKAKASH